MIYSSYLCQHVSWGVELWWAHRFYKNGVQTKLSLSLSAGPRAISLFYFFPLSRWCLDLMIISATCCLPWSYLQCDLKLLLFRCHDPCYHSAPHHLLLPLRPVPLGLPQSCCSFTARTLAAASAAAAAVFWHPWPDRCCSPWLLPAHGPATSTTMARPCSRTCQPCVATI